MAIAYIYLTIILTQPSASKIPTDGSNRVSAMNCILKKLLAALTALLAFSCGQNDSLEHRGFGSGFTKGVNIPVSTRSLALGDLGAELDTLASLGVTTVCLVNTFYVADAKADTFTSQRSTLSDTRLEELIGLCRAHGIEPVLKPHVNCLSHEPRYAISPSDDRLWRIEYGEIVLRYAQLSQKHNLTAFVAGTELDIIADRSWFGDLLDSAAQLYSGPLVYAASYDHFLASRVWDHVDIIGVNAWYPLCGKEYCNLSTMTESWSFWLEQLSAFALSHNKPLVLTEAGFCSTVKSAVNPGDWEMSDIVTMSEQEKGYEALLCQAERYPLVSGICWWEWSLINQGGTSDPGYTPRGKPAQEILRKYWNQ